MIPSALQHRLLSLANQIGPRSAPAGAMVHVEATDETVEQHDLVLAAPALCMVLDGKRSVQRAGRREIFRAGEMLLLPAGFRLQIRDEPGRESGKFRAVQLEFGGALLARFLADGPDIPERLPGESALRLSVDLRLAEAMANALGSLLEPERYGRHLTERLLLDLLVRLRRQGRLPDLAGTEGWDLEAHMRELVRMNPAEPWTPDRAAELLATSEQELEAALREAGGFVRVVADERMGRTTRLVSEGGVSLADLAYACGSASPEFFAARVQAHQDEAARGA
jgi:AraC-like DNA-binding protein